MYDVLKDILVVALEQAVAAPFATRKLADAGARVIKIEREEGDFARAYDTVVLGECTYFFWLNRGKESIVLDIKRDEDQALLHRMLARADVFIQNLAPGAAVRVGFGSEALRERYPRLITCDISGYGEDGPYAKMKAYDNLLQGETGLLAVTGTPATPAKVGLSVVDIATGMHAYGAILEALLGRGKTGKGTGIKLSLFDCMADWMSVPYLHQVYGGKAPPRLATHHPSIAPYGAYWTGDGREVMIAIQTEREWKRFCTEVLRRPDAAESETFSSHTQRVANRAALDTLIDGVLSKLTMEQLIERLRAADIAYGRLNSVEEFARHPQLRLVSIDTPNGPAKTPAPPARYVGSKPPKLSGVPALGEHTEAIRKEFAT